jgi:subtilisin family serine protease
MSSLRILVATITSVATLGMVATPVAHAAEGEGFVPGEIVVGYSGDALPAAVTALLPLGSSAIDRDTYFLVRTPIDPAQALLDQIDAVAGVRFAERNARLGVAQSSDPAFPSQSNLDAIGAPTAWRASTGEGVTIAVVDTGAHLEHPDLAPNLSGGATFASATPRPSAEPTGARPEDGMGHGTEVAGLAAARGDNGIGGLGVAPNARIMPLKVLGDDGTGSATDAADAIRYAAANGARVINLSLTGAQPSTAMQEAIGAAEARGSVTIAAAGNEGRDIDATPSYPASYGAAGIVGIGAGDGSGALARFSNRGAGDVEVAAPGVNVFTTKPGAGFGPASGTSMAAPQVSGVAALVLSARPSLSPVGVRDVLVASAAGRAVAGTASGEVWAPAALGLPDRPGASAPGTGAGGTGTGSPGPGGAGTNAAALRNLRIVVRAPAQRIPRTGRTVLRWTVTGDTSLVRGMRVDVDGRRRATVGATTRSVRLRLRPGRHRVVVRALGTDRRTLGSSPARRFRLSRAR